MRMRRAKHKNIVIFRRFNFEAVYDPKQQSYYVTDNGRTLAEFDTDAAATAYVKQLYKEAAKLTD